jgi:hypothetical protein
MTRQSRIYLNFNFTQSYLLDFEEEVRDFLFFLARFCNTRLFLASNHQKELINRP